MSTRERFIWAAVLIIGTPTLLAAIRLVEVAAMWVARAVGAWPV